MNISEMTGIELLTAMREGIIPAASMIQIMPMNFNELEVGLVRFTTIADDRHLNPMGGVHGGFAATVLDSVTGCVVHTTLGPGDVFGTVDLNIKMLRPIPKNVELIAEGRLINVSKRLGVSEGDIKDANGKIYAHATCTCSITRA